MADDQTTIVDPEAIMDAAQHMLSYVHDIEERLEDMHRWIDIIETFWKGEAADTYLQRFDEVMMAVDHNVERQRSVAKDLESHAIRYGAAERKADVIAQDLEASIEQDLNAFIAQADWAEVNA